MAQLADSRQDRWKKRVGGIRIQDNEIVAEYRNGRFYKFHECGFVYPYRWNAVFTEPISTSLRTFNTEVTCAHSADGVPYDINVKVLYKFNPRIIKHASLLSKLARASARGIRMIATDIVSKAVRKVVGTYSHQDLHHGKNLVILQNEIRREAEKDGTTLGLIFITETPISLTAIMPPKRIADAEHQAHKLRILGHAVQNFSDALAYKLLVSQLAGDQGPKNLIIPPNTSLPPEIAAMWGVRNGSNPNNDPRLSQQPKYPMPVHQNVGDVSSQSH